MTSTTPETTATDRGSLRGRLRNAGGFEALLSVFAVAALMAALSGAEWGALGLIALTVAILVWAGIGDVRADPRTIPPVGSLMIPRTVLAIAAAMTIDGASRNAAMGLAIISLIFELIAARVLRGAVPYATGIAGITTRNYSPFPPAPLYFGNLAVIACLGMAGTFTSVALPITLSVVCILFASALIVDGVVRVRGRRIADRHIRRTLVDFEPVFAVHWDAAPGTVYQLTMWLPELERLERPFFVIVRNQQSFEEVTRVTNRPVLLRKTHVDLDDLVVPSLRAAFYVNNAIRNAHFVRFPNLWHIQLNHGESDKAPSFNPTMRAYDRDFVAGPAAIDRFAANGIETAPGFFEIVGRPQVASIEVGTRKHSDPSSPIVLYAPTWAGFNADSAYSSLPIGREIVATLLERNCAVVYRPHPYTARDASHARISAEIKAMLAADSAAHGRQHVFGEKAEREWSLFDCFNQVDALISDVSSVVPDFLYSLKPYAVSSMLGSTDDELANGGRRIEPTTESIRAAIDGILGPDDRYEVRVALRDRYLGTGANEGEYADLFVQAAERVLSTPKLTTGMIEPQPLD